MEDESLLEVFAAGTATEDQALQAERHISHCRSCSEFVGKLSGHLHDVGSPIFIPGALEAADGHEPVEKARDAFDGARDSATGVFSRSETSDAVVAVTGVEERGRAELESLPIDRSRIRRKAALACAGGMVAVSGCVVAGVGPISLSGSDRERLGNDGRNTRHSPKSPARCDRLRPRRQQVRRHLKAG